jgi:hypothetical protein
MGNVIRLDGASPLELLLDQQMTLLGLPEWVSEYQFKKPRRWRFDRAWPHLRLAVEVEGGIWSGGRHTRGKGYEDDCVKYNEAAILGWRVIRVTSNMIDDGRAVDMIMRALGAS